MAGQESLLFERRNKPEFEGLNSFHGGHCRRKTRTESQCMDGPAVRAILPRAFRARFAAQFDQNSRLSRLPPEKRIPLFSTCWISYSILPSLSRRHDFCIYSAPPPALENRRMVFDFLGGGDWTSSLHSATIGARANPCHPRMPFDGRTSLHSPT